MEDLVSGRVVGPEHLAAVAVEYQETGRSGCRHRSVVIAHSVAGSDEQPFAVGGHRAGTHVVLQGLQLLHHVEDPDDIGLVEMLVRFATERPVVPAVVEPLGVQTDHLSTAGHVPEPVVVDIGRATNALHRHIVYAAGGEFLARGLPEELARLFLKTQQAAQVDPL